jgi:hypothetical protein
MPGMARLRASDWLSLVASVIGVSLGFAAFWVTFDPPSDSTRVTLLWAIGTLSAALIICAIWQVCENVRARAESEEKERRQDNRMDDVLSRLNGVVDSGGLKDRTMRLALELQNFALDSEEAEKANSERRRVGRAAITRIYEEYKRRYGSRVADIEHELQAVGVMTGTVEDHIRPTVITWEDPPGSQDDPFYNTDEWNMGPRSVDSIAAFLWERAADL